MPDNADALIAQGIKPPPPPDLIGPLSAISQMAAAQASAEANRARAGLETAQTGQVQQGTSIAAAQFAVKQDYARRLAAGESPESAIVSSGMSGVLPSEADAALKNIQQQREIIAIKGYDPRNPASLASGGPVLVGQGATALQTQANTAETQLKIKQGEAVLVGQIGNMITSDPTPAGRQRVIAAAHAMGPQLGISTDVIDRAAALPPDQWAQLGKELQAFGMNAEQYLEKSGQAAYNKGVAEAQTKPEKVGVNERIMFPPAAGAAMTGGAIPAFAQPGVSGVSAAPAPATAPAQQGAFTNPALPAFTQAAAAAPGGMSPTGLAKTIQIESKGNPNAVSPTGAAGLGQFIPSTWKQFGVGSPFDPAQSIAATARYSEANARILAPILGRQPTDAELYLAHQQGPQGALKLLANPNARAGDLVGDKAIRVNGGDPNAPASAFTNMWVGKFQGVSPATSITPLQGRTAQLPPEARPVTPEAALQAPSTTANWLLQPPIPAAPTATAPTVPALPAPSKPPEVPNLAYTGPTALATAADYAKAGVPAPAGTVPAPTPESGAAPIPTIENPTGAAVPKTGLAADQTAPLLARGPGGSMVMTGQTTEGVKRLESYAEEANKYKEEAQSAKAQNQVIDNALQAMKTWEPGAFASWKQEGFRVLQDIYTTAGFPNKKVDTRVGDFDAFVKDWGQFTREVVEEASPRGGYFVTKLYGGQLPNPLMDRYGITLISEQLKGINDFKRAQLQASQSWFDKYGTLGKAPGTGGMDFATFWSKNAPMNAFIFDRMHADNPAMYQDLMNDMAKTPEGQRMIKSIIAERRWIAAPGNDLLQTRLLGQ